jgi:hypothetical protein
MSLELDNFNDPTLDPDYVAYLVEQEAVDANVHFARLWDYFRNPLSPPAGIAADVLNASSRPYFQAQEMGLPARLTGVNRLGIGAEQLTDTSRKEIVIENDIAWRVHTAVDFLFGKPASIRSLAGDPETAAAVEAVVAALFDANGGQGFFQELALLGAVYGFVDIILRLPADWPHPLMPESANSPPPRPAGSAPESEIVGAGTSLSVPANADGSRQNPARARSRTILERARLLAGKLTLETIEAPRVLPILAEDDFRTVRYWIQSFRKQTPELDASARPFLSFGWGGRRDASPRTVEVVEIIGPAGWQRYEDRVLLAEGPNALGRIPVVHLQNLALPGHYEGLGDVEPLVPLQDELNTRLSDRANRVTYQSFKMYLAKGIEDFIERPVGPGQMWATHNPDASIQEFGHDPGSPSEDAHIEQVRQAMDKVSGVTPLAAGLVRGGVGNLSSATALKVLLGGLLSRTQRKRVTYGKAVAAIVELALDVLDKAGALRTAPADRKVEIHWPSPLPEDEAASLANAQIKAALGVPARRVLAELGYDEKTLGAGQ